ncbi:carbohydrate-binding protein [Richelia sinica FACHB-800]|uniref:Carbohydrate-binding protein n=1 Tax=Richelia sinica FACHB-800 TaxID=1357546 RepID=A0A975Y6H2_9NOST|nr:carbohydrate binding domain-containing protein [Richelia sinica]QXE25276.1 carbohydrate-binding protein [Richelia sinica FACHB-800]
MPILKLTQNKNFLFTFLATSILFTNLDIKPGQAVCAAPYSNLDFEQQPTSYWKLEGRAGFDINKGYSFKGFNNAWMRNVSGWNGLRQQVRLKPNSNYILEAYVRTSSNVTDGYFGVRDTQQKVWSEIKFGSLPQYTKLTLPFRTGNASTYNIFTGFWALGQDSWVQVDTYSLQGPSPGCADQE